MFYYYGRIFISISDTLRLKIRRIGGKKEKKILLNDKNLEITIPILTFLQQQKKGQFLKDKAVCGGYK